LIIATKNRKESLYHGSEVAEPDDRSPTPGARVINDLKYSSTYPRTRFSTRQSSMPRLQKACVAPRGATHH
jgi:hypothetical protein